MPEDYGKAVLAAYEKRRKTGDISPNLLQPTPGSVREECLLVCKRVLENRDAESLNLFLIGSERDSSGCLKNVEQSKAEKYKQIPKILRGEVGNPGIKYIELIAILIDFSPRPSTSYYLSAKRQSNSSTISGSLDQKAAKPPAAFDRKKAGIAWLLIVLVLVGGGYFIFLNNQQCMYWAGDHYEMISCNAQKDDIAIIAFNEKRLRNLKKINEPDTLTSHATGRVWYFKRNGNLEFYTAGGEHPVYSDRRLLPLSEYMLNRHILLKKHSD